MEEKPDNSNIEVGLVLQKPELENLKNNQVNQDKSSWGGKRPNSGRKKGESNATALKRKFQEYVTEEEVEDLITLAIEQSPIKSDMLKFVLEQLFGKAPQAVEIEGGATFVLEIAKQVADKREANGSP